LGRIGIQCAADDEDRTIQGLVSFNHSGASLARALRDGVPQNRRILIAEEPPPVRPDQYHADVYASYGLVVATSQDLAERIDHPNVQVLQIADFPDELLLDDEASFIKREPGAVLIQANKFSCVPGELYSLRRSVIAGAQFRKIPLDVFGAEWNQGLRRDYARMRWAASNAGQSGGVSLTSLRWPGLPVARHRGSVMSKSETLKAYRVSLVIENFRDYMSEKLLDSAGQAITVYVGPDLTQYQLSPHICISVAARSRDILGRVKDILDLPGHQQYEIYREQALAARKDQVVQATSSVHRRLVQVLVTAWDPV